MTRSPYGRTPAAARAYVREMTASAPLPVRPLPVGGTGLDAWVSEDRQPLLAPVSSLGAAERVCRDAGYRMCREGGLVEISHDGRELVITVLDV